MTTVDLDPARVLVSLPSGGKRTISPVVLTELLAIPPLKGTDSARWDAHWHEFNRTPGNILPITPGFGTDLLQQDAALEAWTAGQGFAGVMDNCSLHACAGSGFHTDADFFPDSVFCICWLSEPAGWDLYFPFLDRRVPLERGTVVLFDSAQPHGVVQDGQTAFDGGAFAGRAPGYFLSLDFEASNKVRRRLAIKKMSSRGRAGFHTLGSDGERHACKDTVDATTGRWSGQLSAT